MSDTEYEYETDDTDETLEIIDEEEEQEEPQVEEQGDTANCDNHLDIIPEEPPKKRKYTRRPPNVVIKRAVIVKTPPKTQPKKKETVVYLVKDDKGEYNEIERPPKKFSKKELKQIEAEEHALEKEKEVGKRLVRTKKGGVDSRSSKPRTQAQIDATKRMLEANKKRRADKNQQQNQEQETKINTTIRETIREVISNPKNLSKEIPKPVIPPSYSTSKMALYNMFG